MRARDMFGDFDRGGEVELPGQVERPCKVVRLESALVDLQLSPVHMFAVDAEVV